MNKIFIVLLLLFSHCLMRGQITPHEAFSQMGRGINMGNTLEAPSEGAWALAAEEYFFDDYKSAGFNMVRIPVRWYPHTDTTTPFKIDDDWMQRVETIVDWALERDFFVILNAHHSIPIKEDYTEQKNRYDAIWTQISERFKDKSEKLFFEMMNEPHGWTISQTNEFNERTLSIIRQTNATRIVIYSGNEWSAAKDLITSSLNIPNDNYIIGTYHCYDPWEFGGLGNGTWGTQQDKDALENTFMSVAQWSKTNNIPVLLGEFGATNVINEGNSKSDVNSRYRHYASNVNYSLKHNVKFTVWDDGGWFNVYQRASREWNELKDILVHYSTHSPDDFEVSFLPDLTMLLNWNNQIEGERIQIQRRNLGNSYKTIDTVDGTDEEYIDNTYELNETYYYRLIVDESDTASSYSYPQYIISTPRIKQAYNNMIHQVPGVIEAEDFDEGGEDLGYHDTDIVNEGEAYRPNEGVDIEKRSDNGYHVGWTEAGEWIEYSVNIEKDTTYYAGLICASMEGGGQLRLKFNDVFSDVINIPSTNSWHETNTVDVTMPLNKGDNILRVEILEGGFNIDKIIFSENKHNGITIDKINLLNIYPNPATDQITICLPDGVPEAKVFLYNSTGVIAKETTIRNKEQVNISNLSNGQYIVEAHMANKPKYRNKFIK